MAGAPKREAPLVAACKREFARRRAWAMKTHGGGFGSIAGLPDFIGCHRGFFFAVECKAPGKRETLTRAQRMMLGVLERAGAHVIVAETIEEVASLLNRLDRLVVSSLDE